MLDAAGFDPSPGLSGKPPPLSNPSPTVMARKASDHPTRRSARPNPMWAKMLAGLRHFGNRYFFLTPGEVKILNARRTA